MAPGGHIESLSFTAQPAGVHAMGGTFTVTSTVKMGEGYNSITK